MSEECSLVKCFDSENHKLLLAELYFNDILGDAA
jgi:hypothetical protein